MFPSDASSLRRTAFRGLATALMPFVLIGAPALATEPPATHPSLAAVVSPLGQGPPTVGHRAAPGTAVRPALVAPAPVVLPALVATVVRPALAATVRHGSRQQRVVALTFDDGWSPKATRQIVAILESEGVAATFFPYGLVVRANPRLWRQIAAAGFPIGNHTLSHLDLTELTPGGIRYQLRAERDLVQRVIGRPISPFMRPPFGAWDPKTRHAIWSEGYSSMILWDIDSRDWTGISAAAITRRAVRGSNGSIVLLHAGPKQTPLALPAIIAAYRARGFTFVTIPDLLGATPTTSEPLVNASACLTWNCPI